METGVYWTINEAETIEQFIGLREDIALLSLGSYFAEIIEAVSDEDILTRLSCAGLNGLFALSKSFMSRSTSKRSSNEADVPFGL